MVDDAGGVPDGSRLECEVCIIGAGAAGIALAREFRGAPFRVVLLEGGGATADVESQALYRGRNVGHAYYSLESSRLRFLGGTTNHWGGMSIPFDPIDFERRDWVPSSGWPIRYEDLARFIARAHEICEIGPVEYSEPYWAPQRRKPAFPIRGDDLIPRIAQFSPPTRFGSRYRADLEQAPRLRTLLGANVVELVPAPEGSRIETVRVATFAGSRFAVSAELFILAAGAIENARLLLVSRAVHERGIGNQHDVVGRYFMERVNRRSGVFVPSEPDQILPFFEQDRIGAMGLNGYLATSPDWQIRERVLNSSIHLHRSGSLTVPEVEGGSAALRRIRDSLRDGEIPDALLSDVWEVLRDVEDGLVESWDRWRHGRASSEPSPADTAAASPVALEIWHDVEPVPNPSSRVRLAEETDALGVQRVELDWQLTPDLEGATIRRAVRLLAQEVGRLGLGRVRIDIEPEGEGWVPEVVGSFHQMGTTRMSADPKTGVVDSDCRVHGIANLYVAGSSVFATAGQANPTLSLLALTFRLADHVRASLTG